MAEGQQRDRPDDRDFAIIADNVYQQLCSLGGEWQNIVALAEKVKSYGQLSSSDVAYIAEAVLLEMGYIERDPHSIRVKLSPLGRERCGRGIIIPPSNFKAIVNIVEQISLRDRVEIRKTPESD